jgi:hypothetical protein
MKPSAYNPSQPGGVSVPPPCSKSTRLGQAGNEMVQFHPVLDSDDANPPSRSLRTLSKQAGPLVNCCGGGPDWQAKMRLISLSSFVSNNFLPLGKWGKYPIGRCIKVVREPINVEQDIRGDPGYPKVIFLAYRVWALTGRLRWADGHQIVGAPASSSMRFCGMRRMQSTPAFSVVSCWLTAN